MLALDTIISRPAGADRPSSGGAQDDRPRQLWAEWAPEKRVTWKTSGRRAVRSPEPREASCSPAVTVLSCVSLTSASAGCPGRFRRILAIDDIICWLLVAHMPRPAWRRRIMPGCPGPGSVAECKAFLTGCAAVTAGPSPLRNTPLGSEHFLAVPRPAGIGPRCGAARMTVLRHRPGCPLANVGGAMKRSASMGALACSPPWLVG